jgi:hypothetical protein
MTNKEYRGVQKSIKKLLVSSGLKHSGIVGGRVHKNDLGKYFHEIDYMVRVSVWSTLVYYKDKEYFFEHSDWGYKLSEEESLFQELDWFDTKRLSKRKFLELVKGISEYG